MKQNKDYKNEALAALRGNWAPAVLVTVVFVLIYLVLYSPNLYSQFSLQSAIQDLDPSDIASLLGMTGHVFGVSSATTLVGIFLFYPLALGFTNIWRLLLVNNDNQLTENLFSIAFKNYGHKVWGMFLMYLFIFLWTLLFIIPGIVKTFSYAMTPYILEENPELSVNDAIDRSRAMMKGHKFDLFYLYLSFIGWALLCILTLGIGFLWLGPYVSTAKAAFYEDVKADYDAI